MKRIDKACCGDCAQCQMLADGEVEMTSCVLDQIFRKLQKIESVINDSKNFSLASLPEKRAVSKTKNKEQDVQEND